MIVIEHHLPFKDYIVIDEALYDENGNEIEITPEYRAQMDKEWEMVFNKPSQIVWENYETFTAGDKK